MASNPGIHSWPRSTTHNCRDQHRASPPLMKDRNKQAHCTVLSEQIPHQPGPNEGPSTGSDCSFHANPGAAWLHATHLLGKKCRDANPRITLDSCQHPTQSKPRLLQIFPQMAQYKPKPCKPFITLAAHGTLVPRTTTCPSRGALAMLPKSTFPQKGVS